MKRILLSTTVLLAFAMSIILFDMSCKKTAVANSTPTNLLPATTTRLGGVIADGTTILVDENGKISTNSANTAKQEGKLLYAVRGVTRAADALFTSDYDGKNPQKINIAIPAGSYIEYTTLKISPDHKAIFFDVKMVNDMSSTYIYSCNIDGSNLRLVLNIDHTKTNSDIFVCSAY